MDSSIFNTNYIWLPDWSLEDNSDVRIVYFRKEFTVDSGNKPEHKEIRISADSRYKLYINGAFVQEGPQKALDLKEWFVDSCDIAPFLIEGVNVAAVEVMRFPVSTTSVTNATTNDSLLRTELPNLYVEDNNESPDLQVPCDPALITIAGKSGWKCALNREIRIYGEDARPAPIHVQEDVSATGTYAGWKFAGYDDSAWHDAEPIFFLDVSAGDAPGNLTPRTIPALRHMDKKFVGISAFRDAANNYIEDADRSKEWNTMLSGKGTVVIPANTTEVVEISAGAEECGYLHYGFIGGKGARIATLCSECYSYAQPDKPSPFSDEMIPSAPLKGDRTDAIGGTLQGHISHYIAAGCGTAASPEEYEPYWFRTFRYIQLQIKTQDAPLTITRFDYTETGYPLDVKTSFRVSDPTFAPIWDICVRTLERCMHETYFDCPFYEQLQYAMDGRSEILFTYGAAADDRLARQAMDAFRRSQREDGMVNSDAPTQKSNVIPGFSIYYLLMVYDHMMYFGDKALVRKHWNAIDRVLNFFEEHLADNGMVGKVGGPIMRSKYWSFIDWSTKWGDSGGVPTATGIGTGSITMESLLYAYGLQKASELSDYVGRPGVASEYRFRANKILNAVKQNAFGTYTDASGKTYRLVQDGPGIDEYSVHAQVFAILTGLVSPEEGKEMLEATVGNPDLAQSSVSFMFYLFRAMEETGCYERTDERWNLWRKMVNDRMTTTVENDTDARSDCHAWAALMCYEMPASVLGVRPASPGFEKVHIRPLPGKLSWAEGDVATPKGPVHVSWELQNGEIKLSYSVPEGMEVV